MTNTNSLYVICLLTNFIILQSGQKLDIRPYLFEEIDASAVDDLRKTGW